MSSEVRVTSETGGEKGTKPERYDLIPVEPLRMLAELYGRGARKYADRNWEKGYDWSLSYAAAQRHLNQFWGGEDLDPEMQLPHVISAAFHCFALAQFLVTNPEYDNRPSPVLKDNSEVFDNFHAFGKKVADLWGGEKSKTVTTYDATSEETGGDGFVKNYKKEVLFNNGDLRISVERHIGELTLDFGIAPEDVFVQDPTNRRVFYYLDAEEEIKGVVVYSVNHHAFRNDIAPYDWPKFPEPEWTYNRYIDKGIYNSGALSVYPRVDTKSKSPDKLGAKEKLPYGVFVEEVAEDRYYPYRIVVK